jgi:phage gpG-like protein
VIRVEANTKALGALYTGLSSVASGDAAKEANREVASVLQGFVDRQFDRGVSPYGDAWAPPQDGGRPGVRSGDLRGAITVRPQGSRILLSAGGVSYAGYFARGTSKMEAREIFPNASNGLPPRWRDAIEKAYRRAVAKRLRGR